MGEFTADMLMAAGYIAKGCVKATSDLLSGNISAYDEILGSAKGLVDPNDDNSNNLANCNKLFRETRESSQENLESFAFINSDVGPIVLGVLGDNNVEMQSLGTNIDYNNIQD